jgi:two-component system nitrogen regulation sensor histidine kinase NtrY
MTNVLKNAVEAIEARQKLAGADYRGRIAVSLRMAGEALEVTRGR